MSPKKDKDDHRLFFSANMRRLMATRTRLRRERDLYRKALLWVAANPHGDDSLHYILDILYEGEQIADREA